MLILYLLSSMLIYVGFVTALISNRAEDPMVFILIAATCFAIAVPLLVHLD